MQGWVRRDRKRCRMRLNTAQQDQPRQKRNKFTLKTARLGQTSQETMQNKVFKRYKQHQPRQKPDKFTLKTSIFDRKRQEECCRRTLEYGTNSIIQCKPKWVYIENCKVGSEETGNDSEWALNTAQQDRLRQKPNKFTLKSARLGQKRQETMQNEVKHGTTRSAKAKTK